MEFKKILNTRRRIAVAVATGALVAGAAGIAVAYVSGTSNTGADTGHVGGFTALTVSTGTCTGTIFPAATGGGAGTTQTCAFTITNPTTKHAQKFDGHKIALEKTDTGTILTNSTVNKTAVVGCKASYFTKTTTLTTGTTLAGGASIVTHVVLGLKTNITENTCLGKYPTVTLTVHSEA